MATERNWRAWLSEPVSGASIRLFRALFGALMFIAIVRFWYRGFIDSLFVEPSFHFHYFGFDWVNPLPGRWMYALYALLALAALGMAFTRTARVSAGIFFVGFTYAELCEKSAYLNHYYLVSLIALLLACVPVGASVPRAALLAIRVQIALVYFFAGVAKLDPHWLFDAQPMRIWLTARADLPIVGGLLAEPVTAYVFSWCGALFDLSAPFLLFWRRTRAFAWGLVVIFHLMTALLFPSIGLFPWIMIAASTIFLERREPAMAGETPRLSRASIAALSIYLALQLLVPLRFVLYPGSPSWSDEGFRFAWRVMIADKVGSVRFDVVERNGARRWTVEPSAHLTPFQERMMSQSPDMVLELSHAIAEDFRERHGADVAVFADAWVSMNGRPSQRLIDPGVDLASETDSLRPADWIVPLEAK